MEALKRKQQTIGDRLKALRLERDLTYDEVGNLAGIAASTVFRIENNRSRPTERTLYKLRKPFPELVDNAA